MRTLRKILSVIIGVTLVGGLTSCSSTGGRSAENSGLETPRYVVAMVTHGAPGDTFWDLVRKGAEDAAKKDNLELRYSNDPQAPNQANLVQSAIDSQVDGIALTMPNADALGPVAKRAADSGIPTVALNATGLPTMLRRNDTGDPVERTKIHTTARRSEAFSRGLVWAATALALLDIITLTGSPYWQQIIPAAYLAPSKIGRASCRERV